MRAVNAVARDRDLFVVSREDDGRRKLSRLPIDNACFLRASDVSPDLSRQLAAARKVAYVRPDGEWLRVGFRSSWDAREAARVLPVPVYECDVHPVRRWITDATVEIQRPRRCYLDLETDSRVPFSRKEQARILSWALEDDSGEWVQGVLDADTDEAERELVRDLWAELERFDQVLSWNGDRFDFPVLKARSERLAPAFYQQWDLWLWLDQLLLFKRMNTAAESGDEKTSMSLEAIAQSVLGEGKRAGGVDGAHTWEAWEAGGAQREELAAYNRRDAELQRRIEAKTGFTDLLFELGAMTRTFPDTRGLNGSQFVEGFLLAIGAREGVRFGNRPARESDKPAEQFAGAFVMDPKRLGILRDVHVADFAGMYPSIIETWNISPETFTDESLAQSGLPSYLAHMQAGPRACPPHLVATPGGRRCFTRAKVGVLASAVEELGRLRKTYNDQKAQLTPGTPDWHVADLRSTACKVARNTFYGVMGSPVSRFYSRDVAESVTQTGVYLIQQTIAEAERRGWEVVYGDTDSIFVVGCTEDSFRSFVAWCNAELYPRIARECNCPQNTIKLEYEKAFERIAMIGAKRYAGRYAHYKGKRATEASRPEIKGLEYKRGDTAKLARRMQEEVVRDLLRGEESPAHYREVVARWSSLVLDGALELSDVTIAKALSKPLKEYSVDRTPPPHVGVARKLAERGIDVGEGTRIEYVVTSTASPQVCIPACDATVADASREYLWGSLVWPASKRVLEAVFPRETWGDFDNRTKVRQSRLNLGT
jgi:DNA polymerase elongation subunit (family B)